MKYDAKKVDMLLQELSNSAKRVESLRKKFVNALEAKKLNKAA